MRFYPWVGCIQPWLLILPLFLESTSAIMVFAGLKGIFPPDIPSACLTALNTTLNCDPMFYSLTSPLNMVGWNATGLTALCTTGCNTTLATLASNVRTACGTYSYQYGLQTLAITEMVDVFQYGYNQACLKDSTMFCVQREQTWNVTQMVANHAATWPTYTNKTLKDYSFDPVNGNPEVFANGTVIFPGKTDMVQRMNYSVLAQSPAGLDNYTYGRNYSLDTTFSWSKRLQPDELPLEIQCSTCYQQRQRLMYGSPWGKKYTDWTASIWANIIRNCPGVPLYVYPTLNKTGPPTPFRMAWNVPVPCAKNYTLAKPLGSNMTYDDFALQNSVATANLKTYNSGPLGLSLLNDTYCIPAACPVTRVLSTIASDNFIAGYTNMTKSQFRAWNPSASFEVLLKGEIVCVGPIGPVFIPSTTVAPASPTIYSTTATPVDPTQTGTIKNCGRFYKVQSGDYCNLVCVKFSITFAQFRAMNPSIDAQCSNLLLGYDYCVAPVNGTTVPLTTTTTYPSPPAQTVAGTTSQCNTWYTTKSGDYCYAIEQTYGITHAQFMKWNTYIDSACDNLWVGYSYCVSSPL